MSIYLRGIDCSRWQGLIDWPRVRESGIEYVIVRASLGATGVDDMYDRNWREVAWAGFPYRAAYHYVITGLPARAQVENILRVTGGDFGNAPFVLDCEPTEAELRRIRAGWLFPRTAYTAMVREMLLLLAPHVPSGHRIYTSAHYWSLITTLPAWAADYGLHVAHYGAASPLLPRGWAAWDAWQYSSTGRVPGIAGHCDLNHVKAAPVVVAPDTLAADVLAHAQTIAVLIGD